MTKLELKQANNLTRLVTMLGILVDMETDLDGSRPGVSIEESNRIYEAIIGPHNRLAKEIWSKVEPK